MKKTSKYLIFLILILAFLMLMSVNSLAAKGSYSVSKSSVTLTEGKSTTVSITAKNCGGRFDISSSNTSVAKVSGSPVWPENNTQSFTITAVKPGTAKITIVPTSVSGSDPGYEDDVTGSKTITVTVKASSSGSNSSSSSSTSSSSSSSSTQKPSFTSTNQKVYAKDNINLRSSWSTSSSATAVKKGTEMTLTGKSSKSVNGYVWYRVSYNGTTKYVSSSLITTTKPSDAKSGEEEQQKDSSKATSTNLKSLNVTPTGLSPAFDAGKTEYTMAIGSNIDEIVVDAVAEDSNASVKVEGNKNLTIGKNKITITVTAGENTKVYNINVTKDSKKQLQLSELLIDGQPLKPEFDSNIYEYTIEKTNTAELNITAIPSDESAEVEILGNTDFKVGENIVTILVKSSDVEEVTTYQITVNVAQSDAIAIEENSSDNTKMYLYIGAGVVGIIIVIIIVSSIVKNRRADDIETYDFKTTDENSKKNNEYNVDTNDLPKLENDDLPNSLKKSETKNDLDEKKNKMSERNKKIDEFYNTQDNDSNDRKKGKHSK